MKQTKERKKLKERNYKERQKNLTSHISPFNSDHEGITLIALVITIIIMLILATVSIRIAVNGGLFKYAGKAVKETQNAMKTENEIVDGKITIDGYTYSIDDYLASQKGERPKVTIDGETILLTPENVADYLGKKVTNYKGKASVEIDGKIYTVSTEYRLYYVDFGNKYKDGAGTIYLKAECTSNKYTIPTTVPKQTDIVKIKELNPELYKQGDENAPSSDNGNMQAVTWITNTNNWEGLKPEEYSSEIKETDINYIVGSPSLEMMMDSYNTHYKLTGDTPNTSELNENSPRVKLFYKYPFNDNKYGYAVGPYNYSTAQEGYHNNSSYYAVKMDEKIDSMYYPGIDNYYFLSSPSCATDDKVIGVDCSGGGYIYSPQFHNNYRAFCPLVSLKSSAILTLEKN